MGAGPLVEGKALGAAAIRLEAIAVGLGDLEENGVRVRVCACVRMHSYVHACVCVLPAAGLRGSMQPGGVDRRR